MLTIDWNYFFKYLTQKYTSNGFNLHPYLQSIKVGLEVFVGTNAKLTTTTYSVPFN